MRKMAATILASVFLILSAVPVFGAAVVDQSKMDEIKALHQQMDTLRVQILDKKVEAGVMEKTQADKIKTHMKERQQRIEQGIKKDGSHGFEFKKDCGRKSSNNADPSAQKTE